jgi:hypothetical protein
VQQIGAKKRLKASRQSRLKLPPRDLAEWIRLANLVPVGARLPDLWETNEWPVLVEQIAKLEDPLRSELLDHSTTANAEAWLREQEPVYAQFMRSKLDSVRFELALKHYDRIRIAAQLLRMFSLTEAEHPYNYAESLVSTLRYADLSYLRQCAYAPCGKVFYAGKSTQFGCTPEHSSNVRKRRKRERDKFNEERKKKRAKTARER